MDNKKIITLVGMMGVGKTTIGMCLAQKLGIYFIDSDSEIEDMENLTITQIFEQKGEKYFRKIENKVISKIISRDEPMVLSLGGGTFTNPETIDLILSKTIAVWLYCDIEVILSRISGKNNRPLLKNSDRRRVIKDLMDKRYSDYKKCHLKADTSRANREIVIDSIINQINNFIRN